MGRLLMCFVTTAVVICASEVHAQRPGFGLLYYNDLVVRTVVPPASTPNDGRDNFYVVTNGVDMQFGIAAVAPGDQGYHGGDWKVFLVTFVGQPQLLTSEAAVLVAEMLGDVDVERVPMADFKCPIQFLPGGRGGRGR